jgi:ornithine cyclodeaminase/alanine dehydrogenase-like protein (mu-crystallin family)
MMSTLLLTRRNIAGLLTPADYIRAVEQAFRQYAEGKTASAPPMHIGGVGGGFHAKGAAMLGARKLAALKLNGNFPGNPARGLPTIQGAILLCDAETGALLAIMDSIEVTLRRTAAASALAARHLAPRCSYTLALIGCGAQAQPHIEALTAVLPLRTVLVFDLNAEKAGVFATGASEALGLDVRAAPTLREATLAADVIVTSTTSRHAYLNANDLAARAFVAAIGADNSEKNEITPELMAKAKVVTDVTAQCAAMGDLHHALHAGAMEASDVYAELADIVVGAKAGRTTEDEIVIFDSTGTAIQDVASAALVYERALERGLGKHVELA